MINILISAKKIIDYLLVMCMCLTFTSISKSKQVDTIYIDPGHGGMDGGCIGIDGTLEKDINLQISFRLRNYLRDLGYNVEMTRLGDYDLASKDASIRKTEDIVNRCKMMENAKLFVSIHVNKYPSESVSGAQTFYYLNNEHGKNNKILSDTIQKNLIEILENTSRKSMNIEEKYLLINTNAVGCLVEVGFISNTNELKLLKDSIYQEKIVLAIANGILEYMEINQNEI